ncbi:MAG TPA: glycosyl hydrolase [Verrucomicrobiales bacterium]|nr:glycosyl hydrolase [Verrucomicrobiales bacterium]
MRIDSRLTAAGLRKPVERMFELSAPRILSIDKAWPPGTGAPVCTRSGRYAARGWTEWTQGFQHGSALLQFEATGDRHFLELGRRRTIQEMGAHLTHVGVHDHGFNNVSTYGALRRQMLEGRIPFCEPELRFLELALKVSGAVQAARWTTLPGSTGYIYSFNGPHSLFIDTLRSLRSLALAHHLGHVLLGERDRRINLLERLVRHAEATIEFNIYFGQGRDAYDVRGRVAHESLFNLNDGSYRCPSTQQGYSPFSTWTRGLAWAILGCSEQLEFLASIREREHELVTPALLGRMEEAARATADRYLEECCADGIPIWDTGAPGTRRMGDYRSRISDPFNPWEPMDSSAAAIAAQGFLRLGSHVGGKAGARYRQAGLTLARTLLSPPYLSDTGRHQGLLLHSVYHRPNGWDAIRPGQKVPNGESSMWGDYHLRELGLMLLREARAERPLRFFEPASPIPPVP